MIKMGFIKAGSCWFHVISDTTYWVHTAFRMQYVQKRCHNTNQQAGGNTINNYAKCEIDTNLVKTCEVLVLVLLFAQARDTVRSVRIQYGATLELFKVLCKAFVQAETEI